MNAKCPYCHSLERTRLLDLYLHNEIKLYSKRGIKLLHFAPENALFKKISQLDIEYIDADINPSNARHIMDITNIHYGHEYFDIIICSHVLSHIPNDELAIQELNRVLKQDGIALILVLLNPNSKSTFEDTSIITIEDRIKYYGEPDTCRLYGLDLNERLKKQGFKVEIIDYRQHLPSEVVLKNSLGNGERELIFKCTK